MINIIVCIKQVLDPEAPTSSYKVDNETNRMTQRGVPPVMSPFDENALEAALRIKDTHQARINVISLGRNLSRSIFRKALAAGADELILLEDEVFGDLDSYATASILATAINKIGEYDIILAGRQAADSNAGIIGPGIAEILGIPYVTTVRKVELLDGKVRVEKLIYDGHEVIETPLPTLITVSNELGELRSVGLKDVLSVQKKPVTTWDTGDLGVEPSEIGRTKLLSLSIPHREVTCEMVPGETDEELAANLAFKLRGEEII